MASTPLGVQGSFGAHTSRPTSLVGKLDGQGAFAGIWASAPWLWKLRVQGEGKAPTEPTITSRNDGRLTRRFALPSTPFVTRASIVVGILVGHSFPIGIGHGTLGL